MGIGEKKDLPRELRIKYRFCIFPYAYRLISIDKILLRIYYMIIMIRGVEKRCHLR